MASGCFNGEFENIPFVPGHFYVQHVLFTDGDLSGKVYDLAIPVDALAMVRPPCCLQNVS